MRNFIQLLAAFGMLANQVANPLALAATASVQASAQTEAKIETQIVLDANSYELVKLKPAAKPDFDRDVLAPLRAEQAARAAAEAARQAALARQARVITKRENPVTGDVWYQLRLCESGNRYNVNTGNGYYGAYQYDLRTWNNYMGYARPDLAPAEVQDAKAQDTQARRGWSPWPACARKLGLL